jgi:diaminopimelate decarboxylase
MKREELLKICNEYGAPIYVYDAENIEKQYKRLLNAFTHVANIQIHYAVKALSNLSILRYMNHLGAGFDTVSIQEAQLALKAGASADRILFTPNGVSFEEIEAAIHLGIQINIDNLTLLEKLGNLYPDKAFSIRINPHVMAGGNSNISVGHIDSKFGISIHQLPHVLRIIKNTQLKINGIHMHTGSDILDIGVFLYASEILFDTARYFPDLSFMDFGSGFKVPYQVGDTETDIEKLGHQIGQRFNQFCEIYGKKIDLIFEPGKYLVSESGTFMAQVNSVKQTTSTVFAQINSGFNHFIRPMFYGAYHSIRNLSNPNGDERYYSVVGYICETDTFASNRRLNEIREGDILAFHNAGAYCFSMSSNYNSRLKPAEVLWYKKKAHLIRAHEVFDDLLRNQNKTIEF